MTPWPVLALAATLADPRGQMATGATEACAAFAAGSLGRRNHVVLCWNRTSEEMLGFLLSPQGKVRCAFAGVVRDGCLHVLTGCPQFVGAMDGC